MFKRMCNGHSGNGPIFYSNDTRIFQLFNYMVVVSMLILVEMETEE